MKNRVSGNILCLLGCFQAMFSLCNKTFRQKNAQVKENNKGGPAKMGPSIKKPSRAVVNLVAMPLPLFIFNEYKSNS
jgi:hypothetical protein